MTWGTAFIARKCMGFNHSGWGWTEPIDIRKDYEAILKEIAGGEFQKLKTEVERLKRQVKLLRKVGRVFVTDETLIEDWDNEYDDWWDSC